MHLSAPVLVMRKPYKGTFRHGKGMRGSDTPKVLYMTVAYVTGFMETLPNRTLEVMR